MQDSLSKINSKPFISIVFPNYNGGDFVLETMDSLLKSDYPDDCYEIIVVDNVSTDESLQLIKHRFGEQIKRRKIKIFELSKNVGAPAAYNLGIKNSRSGYDFILKMDNDLVLEKDCIKELVKAFESDKNIGATGGKVLYYSQRDRLHLIGTKIRPFYAGGRGIGKYKLDNKRFDIPLYPDAVNGCLMLIKKELLEKVGLMDEKYFLYFDDIDLSLRAKRYGFKQLYCYKARAYHNTSIPAKRFQSARWLHYAVYNSFYFMKKNYHGIDRFIFFLSLNFNMIRYACGILLNNNKFNLKYKLLCILLKSYFQGLSLLFNT